MKKKGASLLLAVAGIAAWLAIVYFVDVPAFRLGYRVIVRHDGGQLYRVAAVRFYRGRNGRAASLRLVPPRPGLKQISRPIGRYTLPFIARSWSKLRPGDAASVICSHGHYTLLGTAAVEAVVFELFFSALPLVPIALYILKGALSGAGLLPYAGKGARGRAAYFAVWVAPWLRVMLQGGFTAALAEGFVSSAKVAAGDAAVCAVLSMVLLPVTLVGYFNLPPRVPGNPLDSGFYDLP